MCWNACTRMSRTTWKVMRLFTMFISHWQMEVTHGNAKLDGNLAQGWEVDIALAPQSGPRRGPKEWGRTAW